MPNTTLRLTVEIIKGLARVVAFWYAVSMVMSSTQDAVINFSDGKYMDRVEFGLVAQSIRQDWFFEMLAAAFIGWFDIPWKTK